VPPEVTIPNGYKSCSDPELVRRYSPRGRDGLGELVLTPEKGIAGEVGGRGEDLAAPLPLPRDKRERRRENRQCREETTGSGKSGSAGSIIGGFSERKEEKKLNPLETRASNS